MTPQEIFERANLRHPLEFEYVAIQDAQHLPNPTIPILQEFAVGGRRTGRTTRLIAYALSAVSEGKQVILACQSSKNVHFIKEQVEVLAARVGLLEVLSQIRYTIGVVVPPEPNSGIFLLVDPT